MDKNVYVRVYSVKKRLVLAFELDRYSIPKLRILSPAEIRKRIDVICRCEGVRPASVEWERI